MKVLGKLTIASMNTRPKRAHKDVNNIKTPLCRIMGTATGLKAALDTKGETVFGLTGQFLGINVDQAAAHAKDPKENPDDGEYTSGVCYLPGGIQELIQTPLEALLNSEDKVTANNASLEFAMDLFAVPATNAAGYSFEGALLGQMGQADPFAAIKAKVGDTKLPALPSPADIEKAQKALTAA